MRRSAAALWAAFVLGAWQLASVALLGTSPASAAVTSIVGGLVILVVAAWGAVTHAVWAIWLVLVLGALVAVAPFVVGFRGEAGYVASDLITGILLILLGVVGAVDARQAAREAANGPRALKLDTSAPPARRPGLRSHPPADERFDEDTPIAPADPVARGDDVDDEGRRAA
jgi:hypothetical protein